VSFTKVTVPGSVPLTSPLIDGPPVTEPPPALKLITCAVAAWLDALPGLNSRSMNPDDPLTEDVLTVTTYVTAATACPADSEARIVTARAVIKNLRRNIFIKVNLGENNTAGC